MIGRRGFLKGAAAAPAAAAIAAEAETAAFYERNIVGRAGRIVGMPFDECLDADWTTDWTTRSEQALQLVSKFGGSRNAPPEVMSMLTPNDQERLAALDRRVRRLARCKSMSEAAREAYATGPMR